MRHTPFFVLAAGLLAALPAAAQTAGTYAGTSADGSSVQFSVSTDPNTNALAVSGALIFFSAPCKNSTYVDNSGWGYGLNADITNGKVSNQSYNPNFDIIFSLKFSSDGSSATGTISTAVGILDTSQAKPSKALFCSSPKQTLTVTLQPSSVALRLPTDGKHYVYDRRGHVVGQIVR